MEMLTSRSTKILKFLLSQDKKIFLKDIAEYFKVSERTIRYELDKINEELNKENQILLMGNIGRFGHRDTFLSFNRSRISARSSSLGGTGRCRGPPPFFSSSWWKRELTTATALIIKNIHAPIMIKSSIFWRKLPYSMAASSFYFFTVFPYRGIDYIFKRVKACPAGQGSQHRHQYIVHKGCDDLAESTADDNAHCHINDIALQDKCFKFLHYIV